MPSKPDGLHERLPDRHHRARVYWGVVETIRKTADDRPGMSEHELKVNRTSAGHALSDVASALGAAVENGDVVPIQDPDGHTRYVMAENDRLREAVEWLADADDPDKKSIGRLNTALKDAD